MLLALSPQPLQWDPTNDKRTVYLMALLFRVRRSLDITCSGNSDYGVFPAVKRIILNHEPTWDLARDAVANVNSGHPRLLNEASAGTIAGKCPVRNYMASPFIHERSRSDGQCSNAKAPPPSSFTGTRMGHCDARGSNEAARSEDTARAPMPGDAVRADKKGTGFAIGQHMAQTSGDNSVLKGCKVFVDTRHRESGESLSDHYEDKLRNLGAMVMASACKSCTHIVFRFGSKTTTRIWKYVSKSS